ncbi:MAG: hypothetical protein H0V81_09125 [Solirubrobacterales bacterium]|nr:hypothetical protein [Solirubrobacterales bacterium]
MTTFAAADHPELLALEARLKAAWGRYREHLVDLDGIAYREAERAEWEHLQTDLQEIAQARSALRAEAEPRAA